MPRLIISLDGEVKVEYKIEKVRTTIGRHVSCDIRLDDLPVSGRHAEVVTVGGDAFIHDLNSTNGTYVNNLLAKRCALNDRDLIGIGNHVLAFHADKVDDEAPDFEKTLVIHPGMPAHDTATDAEVAAILQVEEQEKDAGVMETSPGMKAGRLEVLSGPLSGKRMKLVKPLVTLGRPGIQVAVISRRADGYFITHVSGAGGSQTYPTVNGKPTGPQAYKLKDKDVIELAGVKMEFRMV